MNSWSFAAPSCRSTNTSLPCSRMARIRPGTRRRRLLGRELFGAAAAELPPAPPAGSRSKSQRAGNASTPRAARSARFFRRLAICSSSSDIGGEEYPKAAAGLGSCGMRHWHDELEQAVARWRDARTSGARHRAGRRLRPLGRPRGAGRRTRAARRLAALPGALGPRSPARDRASRAACRPPRALLPRPHPRLPGLHAGRRGLPDPLRGAPRQPGPS